MATYEIINPSDAAFIDGEYEPCAAAVLFLGGGWYGMADDSNRDLLPLFGLGGDVNEWWGNKFGRTLDEYATNHKGDIKAALATVHLKGRRSSINDIVRKAKRLAGEVYVPSTP